jgi:hypothetical protein
MILSLSPGDTPVSTGDHVNQHANMWRISDDFWDQWELLYGMFGRLAKWTAFRTPGAWPDADMLPFGKITFGRPTRFSEDEQVLCMTLWCIARSPLILGADMTQMDAFLHELLTNPEVLAVNQYSSNNREWTRDGDHIVWVADAPEVGTKYLAVFNASEEAAELILSLTDLGFLGACHLRNLWRREDAGTFRSEYRATLQPHSAALFHVSPLT